MVKAFCGACTNLKKQSWCFGYCHEKNIQINKPFRNCTKFYRPSGYLDRADEINNWHNMAIEYAKIRSKLVREYLMGCVCPSMDFLIDTYTCSWIGGPRKLGVTFKHARTICEACTKIKEK